jgi:GT2 family glycosyltransferase
VTDTDYAAAVVTFKRPDSLPIVLASIARQSPPPTLTVVADNDPGESARAVVEEMQSEWPGTLLYEAVGENLGPAGGWAAAVDIAQERPDRGSWVLIVDDDDPLGAPGVMAHLLASSAAESSQVAAMGLRGARLSRARARLTRVEPPGGESSEVDYLASGGAPLYRWDAIDREGFFEGALFFGFEDLELGLRLEAAGWKLRTVPRMDLHTVADTAKSATAWREYYKTRSLIWILRQHVGDIPAVIAVTRSVFLGGALLVLKTRSFALARARFSGSADGWRGRLGVRRYSPTVNPAKQAVEG